MKRAVKLAIFAVSLGATQLAAAQTPTPAQRFAEYLKQNVAGNMNGVSNASKANILGTKPKFGSESQDPVNGRTFGDAFTQMQGDSSNSGEFRQQAPALTAQAADPVRREPFKDTFARMQAESSNSGEFKLPADASNTAVAGNPPNVVARRAPAGAKTSTN
jgi:hypothetical protein